MAEYMLSLPGIWDPEMPDGTTGFAMALARDNAKLVEILLAYYQNYPEGRADERKRDIRIAEEAILELDDKSEVKNVLKKALSAMGHIMRGPEPRKPRCKK